MKRRIQSSQSSTRNFPPTKAATTTTTTTTTTRKSSSSLAKDNHTLLEHSCSKHTISTSNSSVGDDSLFLERNDINDGSSYIRPNSDHHHDITTTNTAIHNINHPINKNGVRVTPPPPPPSTLPDIIPNSIQLCHGSYELGFHSVPSNNNINNNINNKKHQHVINQNCKRTNILLPEVRSTTRTPSSSSSRKSNNHTNTYLELPTKSQQQNETDDLNQLNDFLVNHPQLFVKAKNEIFNDGVHYLSESSIHALFSDKQQQEELLQDQDYEEKPVIYVHQREVAHVSNDQYVYKNNTNNSSSKGTILATDNATTCHCLAFRSYQQMNNSIQSKNDFNMDMNSNSNSNNISNNNKDEKKKILGTLCHLDSTSYQECLEKIIQTHLEYHNIHTDNSSKSQSSKIVMEVHIVGGYNDSKNTSIELTDHVLTFLDLVSARNCNVMECILQTCIISSLNDMTSYEEIPTSSLSSSLSSSLLSFDQQQHQQQQSMEPNHHKMSTSLSTSSLSSYNSFYSLQDSNHSRYAFKPAPIIRGLALDVHTGRVRLVRKVDSSLWGPEPTLRRVRLWCPDDEEEGQDKEEGEEEKKNSTDSVEATTTTAASTTTTTNTLTTMTPKHNFKSLLQVHTYTKEQISISPFEFKPFELIDVFCKLPDHVMLSMGSTSPDVEDGDFCPLVRETCLFLMNMKYERIFPLRRVATSRRGSSKQRVGLKYKYDGEDWWHSM